MSANADDPLILAAAGICDGTPVDWRRIRELLTNRDRNDRGRARVARAVRTRIRRRVSRLVGPLHAGREVIGRGQFGTVYRAVDPTLQIPSR